MYDVGEKSPEPWADFVQDMLQAGQAICEEAKTQDIVPPSFPDLFDSATELPEISGADLNAETLGAGLLHHGGLLVRQLYNDKHLAELDRISVKFGQDNVSKHASIASQPEAFASVLNIYRECGLLDAIRNYMGTTPLLHLERAKVRRHPGELGHKKGLPWHQDISFFERKTYAVNCWAAVTPCGVKAPGLSILPRRMENVVGWDLADGIAPVSYASTIPSEDIERECQGYTIAEPELQPGDALLFDEMTLHRTLSRPNSKGDQTVTIGWFFRGAGFPRVGLPLAMPD